MTAVVGGLRARLLRDSLIYVVRNGLSLAGWMDEDRYHLPLQFLQGPHHWEIPTTFNTLVFTSQGVETEEAELGSNLTTDTAIITIDLYAQSDSLGVEVTNDARDLLRGRLPGGAERSMVPILDFRQPTPATIGYAQVDHVGVQRSINQVVEEWARHVFTVTVRLKDTYY